MFTEPRGSRREALPRRALLLALATIALLYTTPRIATADTRGYAIAWFATATNSSQFKENCPHHRDGEGGNVALTIRQLMAAGYSREEATQKAGDPNLGLDAQLQEKMLRQATVNGQKVSVYNYPDATEDPHIETVTGKYAYGFDLGGEPANKFEDPETHERIDNQLWRAVGCVESFRAVPPVMPYPEELSWNLMIDTAPAWLIQISGVDLSKDGPVTLTFDRATQHLERDAAGGVKSNSTYVIDPSPRSHNVLKGAIKGGALTIEPADIYLEGEMPYYSEISIKQAHMRFSNERGGKLLAYWGGHIDWRTFIYMYTARPGNGADAIGIYHALKRFADADPDPKTGQNRLISATYRMVAVPAFIASQDGRIVAAASASGIGSSEQTVAAR